MMQRRVSIYSLEPLCDADIWQACEEARLAYLDGQPRIPRRELVAYLIVRKLRQLDKWGGAASYKSFLWEDDLPNGGFPEEAGGARSVKDVADALCNAGVLVRKNSEGSWKYCAR